MRKKTSAVTFSDAWMSPVLFAALRRGMPVAQSTNPGTAATAAVATPAQFAIVATRHQNGFIEAAYTMNDTNVDT
jgi:hypothetical protein